MSQALCCRCDVCLSLQGNDEVFQFLEVVFDQVVSQFPCEYVHIGGDEVPKARWKECDKCQQRIKQVCGDSSDSGDSAMHV